MYSRPESERGISDGDGLLLGRGPHQSGDCLGGEGSSPGRVGATADVCTLGGPVEGARSPGYTGAAKVFTNTKKGSKTQ